MAPVVEFFLMDIFPPSLRLHLCLVMQAVFNPMQWLADAATAASSIRDTGKKSQNHARYGFASCSFISLIGVK